MSEIDYKSIIRNAIESSPEKRILLEKICRKFISGRKARKTITLCDKNDMSWFELRTIFPPNTIVSRGNKYVLQFDRFEVYDFSAKDVFTFIKHLLNITLEETNKIAKLTRLEIEYPYFTNSINYLKSVNKEYSIEILGKAFKALSLLIDNNQSISPSNFGAENFGDSKVFRKNTALRNLTGKLLACELGESITAENAEKLLQVFGIVGNFTASTVCVYGPFICTRKNGKKLKWIRDLWKFGEPSTLSLCNLNSLSSIELQNFDSIISSENESPFNNLIRQKESTPSIYIAGRPNSAVKAFFRLLDNNIKILHWGDTDPSGLDIASSINQIRPVQLYRCGISDCKKMKEKLKPLSKEQLIFGKNLLDNKEFVFLKELEFSLQNGWLEQEAWNG